MLEGDARLLGGHKSKYMIPRPVEYALQDGQVGHHAAGIEVLGSVENQMIPFDRDLQVSISWVDRSSNEIVVANDELLDAINLLVSSYNVGSGGPQ